MSNDHKIVKTLDNPCRFLFWDLGDTLFISVCIFLSGLLESLLILILGVFFWFLYSKVKKGNREKGVITLHYIYWNFPTKSLKKWGKLKNTPDSHRRDIVL